MRSINLLFIALYLALSSHAQTRIDPTTQLKPSAEGDPRLFLQTSDGRLVFVRIDPATLVLDPAVGSQPPVLRAVAPAPPVLPSLSFNMWAPPTVVTGQQLWTIPESPITVVVIRNGLVLKPGLDYTRMGAEVSFTSTQIIPGDEMLFYYTVEGER